MPTYSSGDTVLLTIRNGRKTQETLAVFQAMQSKSRAIVLIDPEKIDGEELRLVDMRSVRPYYDAPDARERRARHAARMYKMGVRVFRLDKPDGRSFYIETMDVQQGIAIGKYAKRKTLVSVPLHSLWPEIR